MALGDVITMRGGTTVEVINTDAEGRLVMADALVLATEERRDAIVDIATLTGACMRALGTGMAGVMGNNQDLVDQVKAAARRSTSRCGSCRSRSATARTSTRRSPTCGTSAGANGGAIHAGLFLAEFVGDIPLAHIDIAGTAQTTGRRGLAHRRLQRVRGPVAGRSWRSTSQSRRADARPKR